MSFRPGNLIPASTQPASAYRFAWSLLAALILLSLLAHAHEYLSSYPLMLAGMYFLLRRRLRRQDAAMVGSLAFTFSSFNLLHFVQPNAVAAVAHIPWLLAMIDIVMVDAQHWKVAPAQACLALLTGSQILLGCPQYVCFSLLTETGFTLWLVVTRRYSPRDGCETMPTCRACIGCRRNSSPCVLVAKAIGLLVGAVPVAAHPGCPRPRPARRRRPPSRPAPHQPDPTRRPLPAGRSGLRRQRPRIEPLRGSRALMLAFWVLVRRSDLGGLKRLAQVAAALAAAALFLALGSQGRFVRLCNALPCGRLVPVSCRYTVLFQFAVAVLAAIGFVLVEREAREKQKIQRHLPVVDREAGPPRCGGIRDPRRDRAGQSGRGRGRADLAAGHRVAPPLRVLVGPLLITAAALLVMAAAEGLRGALVGLILFMAADLGCYGLSCPPDGPSGSESRVQARSVRSAAVQLATTGHAQPRPGAGPFRPDSLLRGRLASLAGLGLIGLCPVHRCCTTGIGAGGEVRTEARAAVTPMKFSPLPPLYSGAGEGQ